MSQFEHLLIDGYNVLHARPGGGRLLARSLEAALERLVQTVRPIHDFGGRRVTIVLDGRGREPEIHRPGAALTFSLLYAPAGVTADTVIEQLVHKAAQPATVAVVTADRALIRTVLAGGGQILSPSDLEGLAASMAQRETIATRQIREEVDQSWGNRIL